MHGGPVTDSAAVEVVEVVIELWKDLVNVTVVELFVSELSVEVNTDPLNAASSENVSAEVVVIPLACVEAFV